MQQLVPVEMSVEMSMAVHLQLMWEPCGDGDCRGRQFWMCSTDDLYSLVRLVLAIILCMVGWANFLQCYFTGPCWCCVCSPAIWVHFKWATPHLLSCGVVGRNTVDVSLDLSVMGLLFFQWQHVRGEPLPMP